jgi:hypothetical protein
MPFFCFSRPGDFFELCVEYYSASVSVWFNYTYCLNQDQRSIPQNAQSCAQQLGLDWNQLYACANGPMGKKLLLASLTRYDAVKA